MLTPGIQSVGSQWMITSNIVQMPDSIQSAFFNISGDGSIKVKAVKLELGSHQTLAYQDESGAWQLFETPDYATEFVRCASYDDDGGYLGPVRGLGLRVNKNLLDNWYFVGGGSQQGGGQFPINQRGQTSYSTVYVTSIDRWNITEQITVSQSYISLTGIMYHIFSDEDASRFQGKTMTMSVLLDGNILVSCTGVFSSSSNVTTTYGQNGAIGFGRFNGYSFNFDCVLINSGADIANVIAAKLELGSTQTLAYQDEDGNWQLFETPDYGEELAKCQRYYWDSGAENFGGCSGIGSATSILTCACQFPVTMRTAPAIRIYNGTTENQIRNSSNGAVVNVQTASSYANRSGLSFLYDPTNNQFQVGAGYDFRVVASAEL